MKKLIIFFLAAAMLVSVAACKSQNSTASEAAASVASSAETSSATETSSSEESASSSAPASGGTVSGVTVSGAVSRPPTVIKKSPYVVKTETYKYDENNKRYRATYPQLSSDETDYSAVNALIKQTALQTINALGTSPTENEITVKVSDHVAYRGDDFISVTFRETVDKSDGSDEVSYFRAVNYDLKNNKAVSVTDMIQKNDALLTALQNAVDKQMSDKKAANYTADVLQAGIQSCTIYFKDDSLGISLPVSHELGDHEELIVDYDETSEFRTGNPAWSYFIKD
ncbi:MAG: Lipoprotein [Oscillospiraceae bacterium]|jgi:hypothetical protein